LVTSIEGSVLYALYHKWTKPAEQILDGDVYLICDLGVSSVSCTRQEVVSTKPFQLRRLGQRRGESTFSLVPEGELQNQWQ
jgi:hypothetical protein